MKSLRVRRSSDCVPGCVLGCWLGLFTGCAIAWGQATAPAITTAPAVTTPTPPATTSATASPTMQVPDTPVQQGQPADQSPSQPPVAMLRVSSRVVAISAVVKSKDGQPKTGLTKDDFVLKQDGREEPIRYFSQGSELPFSIVLMVDVSGSQRTFIGDESLASDVFFQTMLGRPQDRAMLVQFDAAVMPLSAMTNAPNLLHLGLTRLGTNPSTSSATLLNDGVAAVASKVLAKETGRKAIILLTDGGDNGSRSTVAQAIEQAQRADVQIYSILYSAWVGGTGGLTSLRSLPAGPDPGLKTLQQLSESTGGRVFTVARGMGLRKIYEGIEQDLRLQYELGYTPPPDTPPNSYHKLDLKPKDRGLTVQARKGFFAKP